MKQQWKGFKKQNYRNFNHLRPYSPVLLSGNIQSEHVAAGDRFQTTILSEPLQYKPL